MRFLTFSLSLDVATSWQKQYANQDLPKLRILCDSLASYADSNLPSSYSNKLAESEVPLDAKVVSVLLNNNCTNILSVQANDTKLFLINLSTQSSTIESPPLLRKHFDNCSIKRQLPLSKPNRNKISSSGWPHVSSLLRSAPNRFATLHSKLTSQSATLHSMKDSTINIVELNHKEFDLSAYLNSTLNHHPSSTWSLEYIGFVVPQSTKLINCVVRLNDGRLCLLLWNTETDEVEYLTFDAGSVFCPATVKSCDTVLNNVEIYVPLYIDMDDQSLLAQIMMHSGAAIADKVSRLNSLNRCSVPLDALKSSLNSRQLDTISFFLNSWKQAVNRLLSESSSLSSLLSADSSDQSDLCNLLNALQLLEDHCRSVLSNPDNQWRQLADQLMFTTNSLLLEIAASTRNVIHCDTNLRIERDSPLDRLFNRGRSLRALLEQSDTKKSISKTAAPRKYDDQTEIADVQVTFTESELEVIVGEQWSTLSRKDILRAALGRSRLALANHYLKSVNQPPTSRTEIDELTRSLVLKAIAADDRVNAVRYLTCAGYSARRSFLHLLRHTQSSKMRHRLVAYLEIEDKIDSPHNDDESKQLTVHMQSLLKIESIYKNDDFIASLNTVNHDSQGSASSVPSFYARIKEASKRMKPSSKFNLDNLLSLCSGKSNVLLESQLNDRHYISLRLNWFDHLSEDNVNRIILDADSGDGILQSVTNSNCKLSDIELIQYLIDHRLIDILFQLIDSSMNDQFTDSFITHWMNCHTSPSSGIARDSIWYRIVQRDWLVSRMLDNHCVISYSDWRALLCHAGRSWLSFTSNDDDSLRRFVIDCERDLLNRASSTGSTTAMWSALDMLRLSNLSELLDNLEHDKSPLEFVSVVRKASLDSTPENVMASLLASYRYIDYQLGDNEEFSIEDRPPPHWLVLLSAALIAGLQFGREIQFYNGSLSTEDIQQRLVAGACNLFEKFVISSKSSQQPPMKMKLRKISRQQQLALSSSVVSLQCQQNDGDVRLFSRKSFEISLYQVLESCRDFDLSRLFTWQQGNYVAVGKNFYSEIPSFDDCSSLPGHLSIEPHKLGLSFTYYLSQGRPAFAQLSIISQLVQHGYRNSVPTHIIDELSRWTHLLALKHLDDDRVLSACLMFQQLLGVSSRLLTSYIKAAKWLRAWRDAQSDYCSTPDELEIVANLNISDLLTNCMNEDRRSNQAHVNTVIAHLEMAFEFDWKHQRITKFNEIIKQWNVILTFSDLHGVWPRPDAILRILASKNNWMEFLIVSQIYRYPKLQVRQSVHYFTVRSVRDHLRYVVEKALSNYEEGSQVETNTTSSQEADPFHQLTLNSIVTSNEYNGINDQTRTHTKSSRTASDPLETHRLLPKLHLEEVNSSSRRQNSTTVVRQQKSSAAAPSPATPSLSLGRIAKAAPNDLFDLMFLCTARQQRASLSSTYSWSTHMSLWNSSVTSLQAAAPCENVKFEWQPLLVHALALNNPLLVVLSRCAKGEAGHDTATDRLFIASFIMASVPQELLVPLHRFHMTTDQPKLHWSHHDLKALLECLVSICACSVAAEAFTIFLKISPLGPFFSYLSFSLDKWNAVEREKEKSLLIESCQRLDSTLTSEPLKLGDDFDLERDWMSAIFNSCLDTGLQTVLSQYGARLLLVFIRDWNSLMMSSPSIKKFITIKNNNTSLLEEVLSLFLELSDSLQIELSLNELPVNTSSPDFSTFCCQLIEQHFVQQLPPWLLPIRERLCTLLSPKSKKLLEIVKCDSEQKMKKKKDDTLQAATFAFGSGDVQSLLSSIFAGSNDLRVSSLLTSYSPVQKSLFSTMDSPFDYPVGSASWRSLLVVNPEFNKILSHAPSPVSAHQNSSPEVVALNKALDREQLQEAIACNVYSKDLLILSYCIRLCCNQVKVTDLPEFMQSLIAPDTSSAALPRRSNRPTLARRSSFMVSGMHRIDSYMSMKSSVSHSGSIISVLEKLIGHLQHGRSLGERIYALACVAEQMKEPYELVVKGEELDVLSKILSGAASDKLATADHYLTAIEMESDLLRDFLACICLHVIRSESGSQLPLSFKSCCSNTSTPSSSWVLAQPISEHNSPLFSSKPTCSISTSVSSVTSDSSITHFTDQQHRYAKNVARRCWNKLQCVTSHRELSLRSLVLLCASPSSLGKILLNTVELCRNRDIDDINSAPDMEFLVDSLVLSHACYSEAGNTEGISHCLKVAKDLVRLLTSGDHYNQMTRLLNGIGRYSEMTYVFDILTEKHQFESLLRQDVGKDGKIIPAIFEYLSRYHPENLDLVELVCLKYNLGMELAQNKETKALLSVKKLGASMNKPGVGESTLKNLCFEVVQLYVDASHAFKLAQCYRHALSCFRKAQLFSLQSKWLQRPPNQSHSQPNIQLSSNSPSSPGGAVTLPSTGLPNGVRVFDIAHTEARYWMLCNPVFYESYILISATSIQDDVWSLLLCEHVLFRGDMEYISKYIKYYSRLEAPILKNAIFYFTRQTSNKSVKQMANLRQLLKYCDDIPLINKYRKEFNITELD